MLFIRPESLYYDKYQVRSIDVFIDLVHRGLLTIDINSPDGNPHQLRNWGRH